ncbi:Exportin-4 [Liparis tanakae]|uniref:Exportin-4 n=1 Tax=Liparis tanakae TaxID=230148 RepID=A0A4Z2I6I6_9TELE|nr:Exportin-4 [Liparis tanakae]
MLVLQKHNTEMSVAAGEALYTPVCLHQDTDQEKCVEVRTPRRGRSSQPTRGAEKDQQHKEPEKLEETSSRLGRRSEAAAKEPPADTQKDESRDKETQGVHLPSPVPDGTEAAGGSDSKETTDTRRFIFNSFLLGVSCVFKWLKELCTHYMVNDIRKRCGYLPEHALQAQRRRDEPQQLTGAFHNIMFWCHHC